MMAPTPTPFATREAEIAELRKVLQAATHALRSYQFGNGSPDLAEATADYCELTLQKGSAAT